MTSITFEVFDLTAHEGVERPGFYYRIPQGDDNLIGDDFDPYTVALEGPYVSYEAACEAAKDEIGRILAGIGLSIGLQKED